jgi:hypothetical protein
LREVKAPTLLTQTANRWREGPSPPCIIDMLPDPRLHGDEIAWSGCRHASRRPASGCPHGVVVSSRLTSHLAMIFPSVSEGLAPALGEGALSPRNPRISCRLSGCSQRHDEHNGLDNEHRV